MAHKDLSERFRWCVDFSAELLICSLHDNGQSLALAREAWINAFDRAAEEMEAGDGDA